MATEEQKDKLERLVLEKEKAEDNLVDLQRQVKDTQSK
jgi:hypothetical protein